MPINTDPIVDTINGWNIRKGVGGYYAETDNGLEYVEIGARRPYLYVENCEEIPLKVIDRLRSLEA